MRKHIDSRGVTWDSAQEALDDFLSDLPDLPDNVQELVFQFTQWNETPDFNLSAIQYGIDYGGFNDHFVGYPVPWPL